MKVKNRLLNFHNTFIYQDDDYFLFSLDSVLLANFVTIKLTDKKILDMCSGNAPIPMLLSFRTKARIFGIEIQKYIYELAVSSIRENKMDKQITIVNDDVKNLDRIYDSESFDIITCNPPYFKFMNNRYLNTSVGKTIARHEVSIKLEDVIFQAKYLLKNGGTFALVHRPERLIEIINLMQKYNIEPKKIRFVYPKEGKNANMVLVEGTKNGKSSLKVLNSIIVYNKDGKYCDEIRNMFQEEKSCENVAKEL